MHPETVDPQWHQDLVRRAFDRKMVDLRAKGWDEEDAIIEAMYHVFEIRTNLPQLYQEGKAQW